MEQTQLEILLEAGIHELGSELGPRVYRDDVLLAASVDDTRFDYEKHLQSPEPFHNLLAELRGTRSRRDAVNLKHQLYRRRAVISPFLLEYGIHYTDSDNIPREEIDATIQTENCLETIFLSLANVTPQRRDYYSGKIRPLLSILVAGSEVEETFNHVHPTRYPFSITDDIKKAAQSNPDMMPPEMLSQTITHIEESIEREYKQEIFFQQPIGALHESIESNAFYAPVTIKLLLDFIRKYQPPTQQSA